jgi:hypothetical protein
LGKTEKLKNVNWLSASLPESERVYFKVLADNLEGLIELLVQGLKTETAWRTLYDFFGIPQEEIVVEATPTYIELLTHLTSAHHQNIEKVWETKDHLLRFMEKLERQLLAIFIIRLNKLESEREECIERIKDLQSAPSEGSTAEERTGEVDTSLAKRLADIDGQMQTFQTSQIGLFDYMSHLHEQIGAVELIDTHTDIAAPDPALAL